MVQCGEGVENDLKNFHFNNLLSNSVSSIKSNWSFSKMLYNSWQASQLCKTPTKTTEISGRPLSSLAARYRNCFNNERFCQTKHPRDAITSRICKAC